MVRTQISLTSEQLDGLRSLAANQGISMAALIRAAVDRVLSEPSADAWDRALAAVGSGRSGLRDVSVEHDAYLVAE
jgi:hypothetical protein